MALGVSPALAAQQAGIVLPDTCYILTRSEESNGAGGKKATYIKGDPLPCGLAPLKGGEYTGSRALPRPAGERLDDRTTNVLTLLPDTEITEEDRVEIDKHGLFEVTALRRRSIEILREVELREAP